MSGPEQLSVLFGVARAPSIAEMGWGCSVPGVAPSVNPATPQPTNALRASAS
jgi:hypothetical protein